MHVLQTPSESESKRELRPSDGGHGTLACVAVGPPKNGNSALRRGRQPRARVDVSRFGNERTVDLKGVEHALDVRVSLVLSACALTCSLYFPSCGRLPIPGGKDKFLRLNNGTRVRKSKQPFADKSNTIPLPWATTRTGSSKRKSHAAPAVTGRRRFKSKDHCI